MDWLKRRRYATIGFIAVVVFAYYLLHEGPSDIPDVAENAFCRIISFHANIDGEPLGTRLFVPAGTGMYATLVVEKRDGAPTEIDGLVVEDHRLWRMIGKLTPRMDWPAREPTRFCCLHYSNDFRKYQAEVAPESRRRHVRAKFAGGGRSLGTSNGLFKGEPEKPATVPPDARSAWTFLALPENATNGEEYVCEIFLLPHSHDASALRTVLGPEVVIWRGTITCGGSDGVLASSS